MRRSLFAQPKYTIDTSALLALMNPGEKYEKETFKRLWNDFCALCDSGKIVSHIEVQKEIKDGGVKDQIVWAKQYKFIFQKYDLPAEGRVIQDIGSKGTDFVKFLEQGKQKSTHADPWLVAQAKLNNLILISEESPKKSSIPIVCQNMGVKHVNLLGLMREENWTY
ncbi:MAG TPA: DUF4411 family protein [Candidatus Paceibacterota bacterium]|nr:DUF4411 family protein [Candidatus Paceibacterota bacterium]